MSALRAPTLVIAALRAPALVLAALGAMLAVATPASAAVAWGSCKPAGYECARLPVPLDRSGAVPGTIGLDLKRRVAKTPSRTAIVALAGGPGQTAIPFAQDFARAFLPVLADKDVLVFNQRGTGKSGPISCPAFKRTRGTITRVAQACSLELGPKRAFYTTAQSVEDLEAIRVAAGYDKLIIYGVSYGTKVALAYAAAHPAAVQSMILDSVVTPEGPDALRRSTVNAVPRVIGQDLCDDGCKQAGGDAVGKLQQLAARLAKRSMSAGVYSETGKRYTARLGENGLLRILEAGDLNPALRIDLPGAVDAALHGDRQPILRLSANTAGLDNVTAARHGPGLAAGDEDDLNSIPATTLYFATICEETTSFPWTRGAPVTTRAREAKAAVQGLPPGTFGMFSSEVGLDDLVSTCLGWSVGSPAPAPPGPLPDVPVLVLDGQADLRTPVEDAQNVAARFPRAQVVTIPDTGHSVLTAESGTCALAAARNFLAGRPAAACPAPRVPIVATHTPPRTLSDLRAAKGVPGRAGRTLNALLVTVEDGYSQILGAATALGDIPKGVGGLRSGSIRVANKNAFQFRDYEFVPGVKVSGTLKAGSSTFRVTGRSAVAGQVTISSSGAASGRLGGRRVAVRAEASAASVRAERQTLDDAIQVGRSRIR